ncbi:MAG: hypothetical protein HY537_18080 [Deltaproteobacteria bacterium]|nr:hypothetical protein [Deltaproteobacteria bacterium]
MAIAGERPHSVDVSANDLLSVPSTVSSDGQLRAVALKGEVLVWGKDGEQGFNHLDTEDSVELAVNNVLRLQIEGVENLSFSTDNRRLLTATGQDVLVWCLLSGARENIFSFPSTITSVAISPDGHTIAVGCADRTIYLRAINKKGINGMLELPEVRGIDYERDRSSAVVTALAFSPDLRRLASGSLDGMLRIWDVEKGTMTHRVKQKTEPVRAIALIGSDYLATLTTYSMGHIQVFDISDSDYRFLLSQAETSFNRNIPRSAKFPTEVLLWFAGYVEGWKHPSEVRSTGQYRH